MVPLIIRIAVAAFFIYPYIDGLINSHEDVPIHIYVLVGILVCFVLSACISSKAEYFMILAAILLFSLILGSFCYGIMQSILDGDMPVIIILLIWVLVFIFDNKRKKKG